MARFPKNCNIKMRLLLPRFPSTQVASPHTQIFVLLSGFYFALLSKYLSYVGFFIMTNFLMHFYI